MTFLFTRRTTLLLRTISSDCFPRVTRAAPRFVSPPRMSSLLRSFAAAASRQRRRDPHDVLGVRCGASMKEVKAAYLKLARKHHPDVGGTKEAFQEVGTAFAALKDGSRASSSSSTSTNARRRRASPPPRQQEQRQTQSFSYEELHREFLFHWAESGLEKYAAEIRSEANDAVHRSYRGDYSGLWRFAKKRKGLVASVVFPAALTLRFPFLVVGAVRVVVGAPLFAVGVLFRLPPQVQFFVLSSLWKLWSDVRKGKSEREKSDRWRGSWKKKM